MKNPELYIIVALGICAALSWITSRFSDLAIGLFNTAIGLLFGATTNLTLIERSRHLRGLQNSNFVATDYVIFLAFLQLIFGILVVSTHFAARNLNTAQPNVTANKVKESAFYALSVLFSLINCYILAVIFLHSDSIFAAPLLPASGELEVICKRFINVLTISPLWWFWWIASFMGLAIIRFFREKIMSISLPHSEINRRK